MNAVFADTSFFVSLANANDLFHALAVKLLNQPYDRITTTEYVLVETGNWFSKAKCRHSFVALVEQLPAAAQFLVVPASQELFDRGFDLYRRRPDKHWSLTDCISFVVMQDHGITEALTGDHHFEQAGFITLLKD